jgi:cytochrome c-type biogenesis protein CcmF
MILGITLTSVTFVILLVSIASYYLYYLREEEMMLKIARNGFYIASALILVQGIILMYGIITHHFEWVYVFSYSSRSLSLYYLVSTFWAGQEGTFLLWLIFGSIYGIVIIRSRKEEEPLVMSFMGLIQAFIVLILIKKNPFMYVWDVNPFGFQQGVIPLDGSGLNPLLQDPFMVIHPPILFSGYSSTMILFSFAMAALIRNKHDDWIKTVYPYALYVALSLGTGIILGGYWAYTTLGWGGYWGWDPVENSSLIPWLVSLVLFHGMVIQRRQGGMKRLNLFLAITTFVLVLYGTFLTRSGVLTDFSVHSFGESELELYLMGFLFLFAGIGFITYIFRVQGVKGSNLDTGFFTRELFMAFGMMLILLLATFTLVGTSWPILSAWFQDNAGSVGPDAYNKISGPLAILLSFLIALAPVFSWKRDNVAKIKSLTVHFIASLIIGGVMYLLGMRDLMPLMISTSAVFIILANGQIIYQMVSKKSYAFGGYLVHVGVGFMFIGIITSSVYDQSQKVSLPIGETSSVLGYNIQYNGKETAANGKDKVMLTINGDDGAFARFYWSEYSKAYMIAPSVTNSILEDLYIAPIQIIKPEEDVSMDKVKIKKATTVPFEDYQIRFNEYEMNMHEMGAGNMTILAKLDILDKDGKILESIKPGIKVIGKDRENLPAAFLGTNRQVLIDGLSVEEQILVLAISPKEGKKGTVGKEMLAVEVSKKPLINILWLGTILLFVGFIITIVHRTKKQRL